MSENEHARRGDERAEKEGAEKTQEEDEQKERRAEEARNGVCCSRTPSGRVPSVKSLAKVK